LACRTGAEASVMSKASIVGIERVTHRYRKT
jgi:hypothetical protein